MDYNNGTCGKVHGEMKAKVDEIDKLQQDMGKIVGWKAFSLILSLVIALGMAGAGVFAASIGNDLDDCKKRQEKFENHYEKIVYTLHDMAVNLERLTVTMEHHEDTKKRERDNDS